MNKEEAIKRLKEYAQYSYGIWHNDEEDAKAFDMAIEALKADAVSREYHDMEIKELKHQIKDQADMVSVVRCKYCRQYIPHDLTDDRGWCCEFKTLINEDDFCSWGERETNDRHNKTV